MSIRSAAWIAWSLCVLCVVVALASLILALLNGRTLGEIFLAWGPSIAALPTETVSFSVVGALIASHCPENLHRLDLLGRRLLLWALERRRPIRYLCAPHESRRSPIGSGSVLARAVDLGPGVRPEPGLPATAVPQRSPAFASLAPGGLARRPLHQPDCRVVHDTALAREGPSASDRQ